MKFCVEWLANYIPQSLVNRFTVLEIEKYTDNDSNLVVTTTNQDD